MKDVITSDMIGRFFRITGRRGDAKRHHGLVGRLVWVGEFEGRGNRRSVAVTQRIALKVEGMATPVCVAASQVTEDMAARTFHRAELELA